MTSHSVIPDSFEGKICKIVSDGTTGGTCITLPSGEMLPLVQAVEIFIDSRLPESRFTRVVLHMIAQCDLTLPISETRLIAKKDLNTAPKDIAQEILTMLPTKEDITYEPDGL